MHSPSGLPLSLTRPLHVLYVGQSLFGRHFNMDHSIPLPCVDAKKYNASMFGGVDICASYNIGSTEAITKPMLSKTKMQLELPALECLFEVKCHPEYESVRDECDIWTLSLFDPPLLPHDLNHMLYIKGLYPLFTALTYPSTQSRRRLVLLIKTINWLFLYDDIFEESNLEMLAELTQGLKSVFESALDTNSLLELQEATLPSFTRISTTENVFKNGSMKNFLNRFKHEVWDEICDDLSQSFRKKFVASILRSLNAMHTHEKMRLKRKSGVEEGTSMALDDLVEMRLCESYSTLVGVATEYALNIDLESILSYEYKRGPILHKKLERLRHVVACHMTWTNDLISMPKEIFKDDCLSLVSVLMKQRGVNAHSMDEKGRKQLQEVIKEVWRMIKEQERLAACLLEEVKKSHGLDPYAHKQLVLYCEELCQAMAGNMYWSTLTARYNGLHPLPWNTPALLNIPY